MPHTWQLHSHISVGYWTVSSSLLAIQEHNPWLFFYFTYLYSTYWLRSHNYLIIKHTFLRVNNFDLWCCSRIFEAIAKTFMNSNPNNFDMALSYSPQSPSSPYSKHSHSILLTSPQSPSTQSPSFDVFAASFTY